MKRQCIHALLPIDRVNANHRCFARELDRPDNCIELYAIEIALELISRLPFFDQYKCLAFIEVSIETDRKTTRRYSRRLKN